MTPKKRIAIVGWNNPKYNVKGLAEGFRMQGYDVVTIAADMSSSSEAGTFDYHLLDEMVNCYPYDTKDNSKRPGHKNMSPYQLNVILYAQYNWLRFPLAPLIHHIEKDGPLEFVIICQCDVMLTTWDLPCDWYYYFTEDYKPVLPEGPDPKGVFYAMVGGDETLLRSFGPHKERWEFCQLVPYGMDKMAIPETMVPWSHRDITVGFKGLLHFSQKSRDLRIRHIYDERRTLLQMVEQVLTSDKFKRDYPDIVFRYEDHTTWDDYIPFMQNTKIAINVPSSTGWINQRQYECLGFGNLLVQAFYPELDQLGFKDKVNCLIFDGPIDLLNKLGWAFDHMDEAEQIAIRGQQFLFDAKLSWQDRAKEMLDVIHHHEVSDLPKEIREMERDLFNRLRDKYGETTTTTSTKHKPIYNDSFEYGNFSNGGYEYHV